MSSNYQGLIEQYRDFLPVSDDTPRVSLLEGNTPLIKINNIDVFNKHNLKVYAKFEGLNPTASFKDRGMTLAVSKALQEGSKAVICASTGNTSASAAAYAARAGMAAIVLIPEGNIAMGKLAQAMMHGALVIQIRGNFDDGMQLVKQISSHKPITLVNSVNPYRLQGQKTIAFEVIDNLGAAPDYHCLPVGNAGNISASWMGYKEYQQKGHCADRPKLYGYQAAGAAPFLEGGPVSNPETIATAIRIGNPQSWDLAKQAVEESDGKFAKVSDEAILAAQYQLASSDGIFCEPASAASIAGLLADCHAGIIKSGSTIVCTLTGHGLKDPDIALAQCKDKLFTVDADEGAINALLERHC